MTTALYRRYRPDTFADVIGQEHVTDPLRAALRADRVTHAYLFSGPRGCGKTTSARTLARCLNCAEGPTDTPCGRCDSCVELASGGPGSLDVVEIDAASHGGVDDARDLRERAAFAPARDRYKVFIIDEAHMVTPQGFNALLKLVEEPPAHVKFVFATTEPDKVIGTIRSRTHHYPFRLVPPAVLQVYLAKLCEAEGIAVESGVLPLVVRAGGGSVRDSLSVLDQLMAGAEEGGVSYARAAALLGYTPSTLLDDAVGALAAGDGAGVFRVVDRVVESGRDPRRFVEDLLDRLRDLIVLAASGEEAADAVLRAVPAEELDRMRPQARALGAHRLSLVADIVNTGLTEMVGATSPRLQLELVLTRALLALGAFADSTSGPVVVSRAEPVSRSEDAAAPGPTSQPGGAAKSESSASSPLEPAPAAPAPVEPALAAPAPVEPALAAPAPVESVPAAPAPHVEESTAPVRAQQPAESAPPAARAPVATGEDTTQLRRRWPEVVATLKDLSKVVGSLVEQGGHPGRVAEGTLTVMMTTAGLAQTLAGRDGPALIARAVFETLGERLTVVIEVGGDGPGPGGGPRGESPEGPSRADGRGGSGGQGGPEQQGRPQRPTDAERATGRDRARGSDRASGPASLAAASAAPVVAPTNEAVARAIADWAAPIAGEPQLPSEEVPEPPAPWEDTPGESTTWDPGSAESEPSPRGVSNAAERVPSATAGSSPEPIAEAGLGQVIELDAHRGRTPAHRQPPATPSTPEPEEFGDLADIEDSVDVSEAGGMVGVPLVARMLGGVVIDEIVNEERG